MRFDQLETMRDAGFYVSDIGQALQYRPELFGGPFSELLQKAATGSAGGLAQLFGGP